jgi:hypothetical protein
MMQAVTALLGAVLTVAACYALGTLLLDRLAIVLRRAEQFPLSFVLGASCLHLAVFAILTFHVAYWPVLVTLLVLSIAAVAWKRAWRLRGPAKRRLNSGMDPLSMQLKIVWSVIFALFTAIYLATAWAPEMSPDGSGYHLGFVARYLREHGFVFIPNNFYSSLSEGVELLFIPAFAIGRHSAAALVHLGFFISCCLAIFAYGRRIGKPWAGAAGSLFFYLSPVVGIDGSSAYIDLGVAAIVFGCFYFLEIWDSGDSPAALVPVGLLAGYAFAAKYTAFTILPFALLWIALKARKWKPVVYVAALSLVMAGPWVAKNVVYTGNPAAPFLNSTFRNPYVHVLFEQEYAQLMSRYAVENKWTLPLEVTIRGDKTTGVIGPLFLLTPLALLSLRFREGRKVLLCGLFVLAPYLLNVGTRFLIPALPFFSLALAMALANAPPLLVLLLVFHAWASWPSSHPKFASSATWRIWRVPYKEALRKIPPDRFLRTYDSGYVVARMVEEHVPKGERVLAFGGIPDAYTTREILVSFQSAFNQWLSDTMNVAWIADWQPTVLRSLKFPARRLRRIRVTQMGKGDFDHQWQIHEVRFYSKGMELTRKPEWRLTASPNPWEIQLAFDNNEATRWRSWQAAAPGMHVDVDFGSPVDVDEIDIETSMDDFPHVQLRAETADESGAWMKIDGEVQTSARKVKTNLRRAATNEMHLRGVNYLLIADGDYGAADFHGDPEIWGLKPIAKAAGSTLYEVVPPEAPAK